MLVEGLGDAFDVLCDLYGPLVVVLLAHSKIPPLIYAKIMYNQYSKMITHSQLLLRQLRMSFLTS
jgi:hypothetical protein